MIWFFNLNKASAGVCDNYNELFHYFNEIERIKWKDIKSSESFFLKIINNKISKKKWCVDYCKANQYVIMENFYMKRKPK
jgi:hypothetical protein